MADKNSSTEVIIPGKSKKLDTKEDVADILKSIEECRGLTCLRLSGNSFGEEAMTAIGECLANKPQLSKALWSDMFVSRLKAELPPALTSLAGGVMAAQACLTELDLSDNAFGPVGVEALVGFLTSSSCFTLKIARFNNNGLGIKGGTLLSKALLDCHEEAQKAGQRLSLEVFVAGRNRLEDEGAKALSRLFETLGTLVQVCLPQNGINHEGVSALATAFSKNPNLQTIDLNDNTMTEEGSIALAEVLPNLQNLKVLNFGDCLVRNNGARAIAGAIKNGHRLLQDINLSFCELSQDVAMIVADSLANKEELRKIDLNGNCFGAESIEMLKESLEAKNLLDALGSFSEDEGDDDDDEGDDDDGGDGSGEEPAEETEGDVSTDEKLAVKGEAISPQKTENNDQEKPPQPATEDLAEQLESLTL
ncbi:ran GTPase-activating protein 1-like isoform X2 [Halichondria panicea]|uniref:ran GTPase-activating protein 1-like isoform X2 n=1 Tax=Halichondria panicea TaxID=6063 RepID=UPI00312B6CF9